ncbi:hypothetical protein J415_17520 [Klebsiella michiganensis HKOPL1]|uniref:Uncharacterized protein n=1 Tax=Klebsiella michiganensis (strain ATCC 8724 / DSM 4798 / JCM 20051 / NBRC 3318 / NRRL B-199 / KCTC 1686 / BUCSAV 143 / CCM 1901) TaxID=1006551 RepID=A0A0H3H8X9_KLEM8|nr:hypothetical protein KOX_20100 [Klebsiella michiganensis KCTC 1686]AHW88952.1 hypothetical protein J415_17520 [Klebsiella michiganensis HKOPL1]
MPDVQLTARIWLRRQFARETRWSYRNWTGWPVQFRMQEILLMPFRPVA